jgi:two-component system response regulator PilR (NtrC family)
MSAKTVLIVDDEPDIRELLEITLNRMGLETRSAADLQQALDSLATEKSDLCLTDMRLPDGNGISLVEHIQQHCPEMPVAMITAHGSVETAITALKAGAFDFISKPIELENLRNIVSNALKLDLSDSGVGYDSVTALIGKTPSIDALRQQIGKLARSQAPVYLSGESGSGKEVVARLIHSNGPRSSGRFVGINCGAIPPELMESELFGHTKGSFTGAHENKEGLFQAASGGTLFLDEVADLPLAMQVKLLRVIQEKTVRPIGASEEIPTDVRILSATHKDLNLEVEEGRFRSDLFYRVNVIALQVPSLRERRDDIPLLADFFLKRLSGSESSTFKLDDSAQQALAAYSFPGNVRELENILERACTLCSGEFISADDLQLPSGGAVRSGSPESKAGFDPEQAFGDMEGYLEDLERQILTRALETSRWNKTSAAKLLGISFRSLRYRLKKLDLED